MVLLFAERFLLFWLLMQRVDSSQWLQNYGNMKKERLPSGPKVRNRVAFSLQHRTRGHTTETWNYTKLIVYVNAYIFGDCVRKWEMDQKLFKKKTISSSVVIIIITHNLDL